MAFSFLRLRKFLLVPEAVAVGPTPTIFPRPSRVLISMTDTSPSATYFDNVVLSTAPDGGTPAALLGSALIGLVALRRRFAGA